MIKATKNRILVKMIPATDDFKNILNLTLVDKKKHFDHVVRRGVVMSVGRNIRGVKVGETVLFSGTAGFTLDGDPEFDRAEYGETYRWLSEKECFAVVESEPQAVLEEA